LTTQTDSARAVGLYMAHFDFVPIMQSSCGRSGAVRGSTRSIGNSSSANSDIDSACAVELGGWQTVAMLLGSESLLRQVAVMEGMMVLERQMLAEQLSIPGGDSSSASSRDSSSASSGGSTDWGDVRGTTAALVVASGVMLGVAGGVWISHQSRR
jgi:hypothetical protein